MAARAADRGVAEPAQFGLRGLAARALRWLLGAWVAFIAFSGIWAAALGIKENDDLPQELGADDSSAALFFVAVLVCVAAPIAEEFFFRGFCFTALRRWIGSRGRRSPPASSSALIHAGSTAPASSCRWPVFGVLQCLLYVRTGSLLPCIVLHALNNSFALGVSPELGAADR